MNNVTKLSVVESNPIGDERLKVFDEYTKQHRKLVEEHPGAGFVLVAYWRPGKGRFTSAINYMVNDPMDAYALPDFVKERIINLRDKD